MRAAGRRQWTCVGLLVTALVAGVAATCASLPAAASPIAEQSPGPGAGVKLRIGTMDSLRSLEPLPEVSVVAREVWLLTTDGLVASAAADFAVAPGLAKSWSVSPDGTTWTFRIRGGAVWHDGRPVTAWNVAAAVNDAVQEGRALVGSTRGIEKAGARDDRTLIVVCSESRADLLDVWMPLASRGSVAVREPGPVPEPGLVGSGPFRLADWRPGEFVRLTAHPGYWGGKAKIDEVLFLAYRDAAVMVRDLQAGLLDAAYDVPPGMASQLREQAALTTVDAFFGAQDRLVFNCSKRPSGGHAALRDPEFRRALAWAIDRESIVRVAYGGLAEAGASVVAPSGRAAAAGERWQPGGAEVIGGEVGRAAAMLDAAGYKDTDGDGVREVAGRPITLRLLVSPRPKCNGRTAKLTAGRLEQIGIAIQIEVESPRTVRRRVERLVDGEPAPDFDLLIARSQDTAQSAAALEELTAAAVGAGNDSFWTHAEFDRLYAAQLAETDPDERRRLLHRLQRIVYRDCPLVVLAYPRRTEACNVARWSGWVRSPLEEGGVLFTGCPATYLAVQPVLGDGAAVESGSSRAEIVVAMSASVVVLSAAAGVVLRRRRARGGSPGLESEGAAGEK